MAVVELEIWHDGKSSDYARLFTELEDETADELYESLFGTAQDWCEKSGISAKVFRRTTGKDVQLAHVLQWYTEEGLLVETQINGKTAFLPVPSVQEKIEGEIARTALVSIDK